MVTTVGLGLITLTIGDSAASSTSSSSSSKSSSTKSTKTSKSTSTKTSSSLSSSSSSSSSLSSSTSTSTSTSLSSTSPTSSSLPTITQAPVSTSTPSATATPTNAPSPSHSHTSPGLIALGVIAGIALLAAAIYLITMRRHLKQREWTFQQHQRIFEQSGKFGAQGDLANEHKRKSRISQWFSPTQTPPPEYYGNFAGEPPLPTTSHGGATAWGAGTGGTVTENYETPLVSRKPVPPPKQYPQTQRRPDDSYRVQNPAEVMHLENYELGRRG